MKRQFLRCVSTSIFLLCCFSFLISCGSGGDDEGAPAVGSIVVTAGSTEIVANGSSLAWISAVVQDSEGQPVDDGTLVSFTTTSGTMSPTNDETYNGVASVNLISSTKVGSATVTATAIGTSANVKVTFVPGPVNTISLTATPDRLESGGEGTSEIRAQVTDANGNAVSDGEVISFSIPSGTGTLSAPTVATSGGVAIVTYTVSTTAGTVTIQATSANNVSASVSITVPAREPVGEGFSLSRDLELGYWNISGLTHANLEDKLTASLVDVNGNAVKDNTLVYFKTYSTGGRFTPASPVTTNGSVTSSLFSTAAPVPLQGFVSATAETEGGPTTQVTSIEVTPAPDNNIIYAGTNGGGVYKSTDYGETWETVSRSTENPKRGQNFLDPYIKGHSAICVDPDNHNAVYAGTGYQGKGNVFRSLDAGMNWNSDNVEEWNGLLSTNTAVLTVLCDGDDTPVPVTDYPYVWIGTEGQGILYATDGENFQPSGGIVSTPVPGTGNTGTGTMSVPTLWYSSKTEDWTVTCKESLATATAPVPGQDNVGDGAMSAIITTTTDTVTEDWTVTYGASVGTVTGTSKGNLANISLTKPNAASETWTLMAMDGSLTPVLGPVTGTATLKGSVAGISVTGATETEIFTLTCTTAATGVADGKFEVNSSERGLFGTVTANGNPHTLTIASGAVTFTISICGTPETELYARADVFTFTSTITAGTTFSVRSSEVGYYSNATVGTPYDGDGLSFLINEGPTPFVTGDFFQFTTTASWQVIGTVSGLQTNTATMETAYTSDNNEVEFTIWAGSTLFETGDKFTFSTTGSTIFWQVQGSVSGLQSGVAQNNLLYRSDNYEVSFLISEVLATPFVAGDKFTFHVDANDINHGRTVWDLERVAATHGSTATLYAGTATGVYKSTNGGRTWAEPGNFTGDYVISLALHPSSTGGASDVIYAGTQNGAVWVSTNSGIKWAQYAGMEAGAFIKDILLDPINNFLYAITYKSPVDVDAATGSVYVHAINADGSMGTAGWKKVSTGLTGKALHAMAIDDPADPAALYTGGEGINFYMATGDLSTGIPTWQESKDGLTNVIMARMPILFSGICSLDVRRVTYGNTVYFTVYLQDLNGNPPIKGSKFEATYTGASGDLSFYTIEYIDCYTNQGTFSDPGNGYTNNPYTFGVSVSSGDEISIVFTPANTLPNAPGSSGSKETLTYMY